MADASNSELSQNAGLGSRNPTEPSALDVERQPQPASAPETGSDVNARPTVPLGPGSKATESPVEGAESDNPVHHTGHIPPPVTANRE